MVQLTTASPIIATLILISGESTLITNNAPVFEKSPSSRGSFALVIGYRQVTTAGSEQLSSLDGPFLHIGNLSIGRSDPRSLNVCIRRPGFEGCVMDTSSGIRSIVVRSPGQGNYSFPGWLGNSAGIFSASDGRVEFGVLLTSYSFISVLSFGSPLPTGIFGATASLSQSSPFEFSGVDNDFGDGVSHGMLDTRDIELSRCYSRTEGFERSRGLRGSPTVPTGIFGATASLSQSSPLELSDVDNDFGHGVARGMLNTRGIEHTHCYSRTEGYERSRGLLPHGPREVPAPPARQNRQELID
jgi:hypothetical protein